MAIQEEVIYEGRTHIGDFIVSIILLLLTAGLWIPAWASLTGWIFVRYRFTNLRMSVDGGWLGRDHTEVTYREIVEVKDVPATLSGAIFGCGTLLLVLKDGARLELKAVPKFREIADRIRERMVNPGQSTISNKAATKR